MGQSWQHEAASLRVRVNKINSNGDDGMILGSESDDIIHSRQHDAESNSRYH